MCIRNHARMFNLASTTCPPGGGRSASGGL